MNIKKTTIALLAVAVLGTAALPVLAKNEKNENMSSKIKNGVQNGAVKSARTVYNQAVKQANTNFNAAKKTAKNKFVSAINSATDQASRITALKAYLSDILAATKTRSTAKEAALQAFINAITVTP